MDRESKNKTITLTNIVYKLILLSKNDAEWVRITMPKVIYEYGFKKFKLVQIKDVSFEKGKWVATMTDNRTIDLIWSYKISKATKDNIELKLPYLMPKGNSSDN